ncbi:DUF3137 domain-containing protein [Erysipelothrix aquatica]|uniref:DUF3137 domain-containing protein n=1 Tax=Erysipelothrix aquatica TaxID=2683714 RepID=UPI00135C7D7F|nr:DUF3137 domain-containing protein [Erysipelothrix aquatica]
MNIDEINKKLKPLRDDVTRTILVVVGIMLCVTIFLFAAASTLGKGPFGRSMSSFTILSFMVWMFVLFVVATFLIKPKIRTYKENVKTLVNKSMFESAFNHVVYDALRGFDRDAMRELGVMETGNQYHSNDFVRADYAGVTFERADVLSQNVTSTGKTTITTTYFHGQVIKFDFHKETSGYVRIRDAGWFNRFSDGPKTERSRKIKFEDDRFNDQWATFTNDEQEAYRIFTPHFMEKINAFRARLGHELSMVLKDGVVYLGIYSSRDAMEPNVFSEIDESYLQEIRHEIESIQYIIDTLTENKDYFRGA